MILGAQGEWTDSQEVGIAKALARTAGYRSQDDQSLINELTSGISASASSSFPTDGTLHIYSR